ncbi:MAG: MurR/RpiR family transcriptional regulator, partial [Paraclostridium sp.]
MFNYEIIQNLNSLELSLYDYVMKNSKKVMYMRIRELADEAHVSTTTILRFCKKLKCEGFSEFKVKFKMYIEEENIEKVSDDTSEIINFFKTTENSNLDKKLDELCDLVKTASNIIFIGSGSSGILCKYAARYFSSIGKFTVHIDD